MIETLKRLGISKSEPIVVAVSGGPDSMALLSLLEPYFETIICAHVNHNTGRVGQDQDEALVKEYCFNHQHFFESMKIENYDKDNFHNQAHKKRYDFFKMLLKKYNSQYLFTAHHGDDLIETMLFRMIRGATINALHGFSEVTDMGEYKIVRPLLTKTKQELLEYVDQNGIPYRIDPSNEKDVYTRNRIRKYMLPLLKQEQPNVHKKFLKLSVELEEMETFLEKKALEEIEKRYLNYHLSILDWQKLDAIIQKRVLQMVLGNLYQDRNALSEKHIVSLQKLIGDSISGAKLSLPNGIQVRKEYQTLLFEKEKKEEYEYILEDCIHLSNGHEIKVVNEEDTDSNFVCRLNKKDVIFPLIVRTRKPQDKMLVKGLNGSKKIKDIFINSKVPVHERENWPIVTDNSGKIVWLPGLKKTQFDKTKEEKYDIILRYY